MGKSQMGSRLVFENAKAALAQALSSGPKPLSGSALSDAIDNAVLSQSYLRLEQQLLTTKTNYLFPVLNNQTTGSNSIRATEFRLNLQDSFFVSEVGVYITPAPSATSTALVPYTYPNTVAFPTGAASLYTFYCGALQVAVNNSVIITGIDLQRYLMIPQTQATAATNSPQTETYGSGELSAQCVVEPNVLIIGSKNTQISITLPGNIATLDANTYAILIFRGVLMQNVTVVS